MDRWGARKLAEVDFKEKGLPRVCSIPGCTSTDLVDLHHEDYNKPLEYELLCRPHHTERTNRRRYSQPKHNDGMVCINLKISEDCNEQRKSLNASWREVLMAGLKALQNPDPLSSIRADLRPHLVAASKSIKAVDDILKGVIPSGSPVQG